MYQCWWRTCREINVFFFPGSNNKYCTFYIHLWPIYWLFPRTKYWNNFYKYFSIQGAGIG
jgi:hypothetical protein